MLHPLPKIDELYAKLNGAKIFSMLDLTSGYYHIKLNKDLHAKTAFVTPFGKWEFNMVPFSLAQAPAYFQALIPTVLEGLSHFAITYLDDIIIFSKYEEEHLQHLEIIFERLCEAGLKLKRSKCSFMKMYIEYLGHLISEKGIEPMPDKFSAKEMPAPRNPKEIKQFLGLVGYYHKFIPRFSDIAKPLTRLTRHDTTFEWCKKYEFSFQTEGCTMHRTHIEISRSEQTICVVHRCFQTCMGWSFNAAIHQRDGRQACHSTPSGNIHEWTFHGFPIELGSTHQGGVCFLYVC